MYKFLIIGVALFVLYKLLTNEKGKKNTDKAKEMEKKIASGELVQDPICGTYVDSVNSISVKDGNKMHKFCSYDCREKFLNQLEESGRAIPEREKDE